MKALLAVLFIASVPAHALNPSLPPGSNFDMSHWYLKLPDSDGSDVSTSRLIGGYTSEWFYTGADGAMVFWCPVTGGIPDGSLSSYSRSELREVLDPDDISVNWLAYGTHILDAQCKVTQVPSTKKVIIGQIHAYSTNRPLVKLQYSDGTIEALVKDSPTASSDTTYTFANVGLSNSITYQLKMVDGIVSMTVNGTTKSANVFQSDPAWANHDFYFKAGSYVQDNSGPDTEGSRVGFYQLSISHSILPPSGFAAPTGLRATAVTSNEIDLAWTDNSTNEDAFLVERSANGVDFLQIQVVRTNVTAFADLGLSPATTYYYRVRASNTVAFSAYSSVLQATTPPVSPTTRDTNAPAAVSDLRITNVGTNSVALAWTAPGDDGNVGTAARYDLRFNTSSISQSSFATATSVPGLPAPSPAGLTETAVVGGLNPATKYYFALKTADETNNLSPLSNLPNSTTLPNLPVAPTGLRATVITSNQIGLNWIDNANNEDGFKVERSTNGVNFVPLTTTGRDVTNALDGTVLVGITNYYRVRAYNVTGDSDNSNTNTAKAFIATGALATLIASNSVWKYLDNGSDQSTAWRALDFDDSTWASGPAPLGYNEQEATTVSFGPNASFKHVTTYFRHKFSVADPAAFTSLNLLVRRDDGAVVYMNGQEVFRSNMPTGAVTYLTFAASGVSSPDDDIFFAAPPIDPALLVPGDNVAAAETHQRSRTSSDIVFNLALAANNRSAPMRISAVVIANRQVSVRWNAIPGKTYQVQHTTNLFSGVWTPLGNDVIPVTSQASVTDAMDAAGQRFYRVLLLD